MAETVSVLISQEDVEARIKELAAQISKEYEGQDILLVCILKGSIFFTTELAKHITLPVTFDFMSVSSYGDATVSSGRVKIIKDLDDSIEGKNVIVIEDIIDSGRTLHHLLALLSVRGPKSLKLCTLLDKPDRREVEVDVDYTGFKIPDAFVVGYGLDYKQHYRNLPYVGVLHLDEE
ncbi:MAG: hypoxanthine phosphoribosyltransferase [Lachnospiraceae bacterium]|nr:hypoxanthine phosphoribosyltransferase [Lachnospiraceae bacterium]